MAGQHVTITAIVAAANNHADPPRLWPVLQQALPGCLPRLGHQAPATLARQRGGLGID
ncbi:hypothetical protein D3C71_1897390 [compost metagenome]